MLWKTGAEILKGLGDPGPTISSVHPFEPWLSHQVGGLTLFLSRKRTLPGKSILVVMGYLVTPAFNTSMTEVSKLSYLHFNLNFPRQLVSQNITR